MKIKLRCKSCSNEVNVSYAHLFSLWKADYERQPGIEDAKTFKVSVSTTCSCGKESSHSSPMFLHIFQVIFNEMLRESKKTT